MKISFDFTDYKAFLEHTEKTSKAFTKGFRTKLAEHIGCQSGYISHVLNGDAHLSLEQAYRTSEFLKLDPKQRKYFLTMVEFARAGTADLKSYFKTELTQLREEFLNVKERVGKVEVLSESEQATYYSSWHYSAIHVLSSLPGYNDIKSIAAALRLDEKTVAEVLLFFTKTGLVIEEKGKLKPGKTQIHLSRDSALINAHHTNWRLAAIRSLADNKKKDLHYSTLSTLSKDDAEKLRAEMVKLIESYVATVKPSPEEVMYGFNLDFYSLID